MTFRIRRASSDRVDPCEGAKYIATDFWGDKHYTIEVNTLDDIMRLAEIDNDGVIISRTIDKKPTGCEWEIMIYDGYIE